MADNWVIIAPVVLGLLGIYLLLPRPRGFPVSWGASACAVAVILTGWLLIHARGASPETVLFYAFSFIAVVSGGMLITLRNPVHAALSFALVVLSTCGLFLLQAAPFLMAATVIVYAGAIVVTFLFVIMLAQQAGVSDADQRSREPLLASIGGFVLLGTLLYLQNTTYDTRTLDALLHRTARAEKSLQSLSEQGATGQAARDEVQEVNGLLSDLQEEANRVRSSDERSRLRAALMPAREAASEQNVNLTKLRESLANVREVGGQVRDGYARLFAQGDAELSNFSGTPANESPALDPRGRVALPAENVAALGKSLFTDYLLAVELGGTLLLVATIGAIAIAGRRAEGLR